VPGRALLMSGRLAGSPRALLSVSLLLHGAGLAAIAFASSTTTLVAGASIFAVGAGLMTIVRPYVIQSVFGIERAGDLTGRVARTQQLARAAGPFVLALLASRLTYGVVLAVVAASFVMVVPAVLGGLMTPMKETV
jgi:hypothetical protein